MKTIKYLLICLMALPLASCDFDINIGSTQGNGNVITEDRHISEDFDQVKGSAGLDVYLTEGNENKVVVEADENLMELIETTVSNGKLKIGTKSNIGRAKAKKIHVTYTKLKSIEASSGADVIVNSVLKSESLTLDASSGSDVEVEIFAKEAYVETSSGAEIKVTGKTSTLKAKASSGSEIDAKELETIDCIADASSGGDITVTVKDNLEAEASSGGSIDYYGDPAAVTNNGSRSGNVRKM
ncbi:head GIN domain-containing protein [Ulvibacter antarcticus]|uniref:Putative autotransporter adhesin-like protein n=1 Tax=Ulvibacter antarcticus TaxID=442714 RepID=A0A3L9YVH7_9FLAO|nr:head GIN domain-containing protein [Ulvibacter antarcticus]RMA64751.1 putative autotransporter adhesin-like protein [Ulvibacter antarcticus]